MTEIIQNTVRGAIQIGGSLDRMYFGSWKEFIEALPQLLLVEVPASVSGVVVSKSQPSEDDSDKLWVRKDTSGGFIGLYLFQKGKWRRFFNSAEGEVHWIVGDSEFPPDGFVMIDDEDEVIPSYIVESLKTRYIPKQVGEGFAFYAARFESF